MYVAITKAGGVEGAISQKVKLLICCSTPEAIAVWFLNYQNLANM